VLWQACTHCASDMSRFAFQEPKKVVEHYAAGEGEGEEAPKVTLLLFLSVPSLLACELHLYKLKMSCLMLLLLLLLLWHGLHVVDMVVML